MILEAKQAWKLKDGQPDKYAGTRVKQERRRTSKA